MPTGMESRPMHSGPQGTSDLWSTEGLTGRVIIVGVIVVRNAVVDRLSPFRMMCVFAQLDIPSPRI